MKLDSRTHEDAFMALFAHFDLTDGNTGEVLREPIVGFDTEAGTRDVLLRDEDGTYRVDGTEIARETRHGPIRLVPVEVLWASPST